jgi:anionic cell wall polymer biosynthesis LytR-Cps2A-Psr (LCP) family protein
MAKRKTSKTDTKDLKESEKNPQDKNEKKVRVLWFLFLFTLISFIVYILYQNNFNIFPASQVTIDSTVLKNDSLKPNTNFANAVSDTTSDTTVKVLYVSNAEDLNVPFSIDKNAGQNIKRVFSGRRINIIVTGVDSRLGTAGKHADANHILSILPDSGVIEITSIPRDTPAEAGMPDTSGQNKLTIVRAIKGREAYFTEAAKIAGLDKIHYWVEAGFSQVMGILNLLGFKDPGSALQVLRSRTGLGGDDYQRSYNQGQFIRQSILHHFNKFTGVMGEIAIRGGLAFVETNLTAATIKNIISQLEAKKFPKGPESITIKVRPPLGMNFKVYDFTDQAIFNNLKSKIESYNTYKGLDSVKVVTNVGNKLKNLINKAIQDSSKRPNDVIKNLSVYFDQRAWHQINEESIRNSVRDQMGELLANAYSKKKQFDKATNVRTIVANEKEIFSKQIFEKPKNSISK